VKRTGRDIERRVLSQAVRFEDTVMVDKLDSVTDVCYLFCIWKNDAHSATNLGLATRHARKGGRPLGPRRRRGGPTLSPELPGRCVLGSAKWTED
jgi:hypothetical protein